MVGASVAVVTGASSGIGREVSCVLSDAGYQVFASGRTIDQACLPEAVRRVKCDHRDDDQTRQLFQRVRDETGRLDLLVNNAWGGYARMVEGGRFTWLAPFWEQPLHRWSAMIDGGVRIAFVASAYAAPLMIELGSGLIVNLSFWASQKHIGNTIYGIAKAATDKLTSDCAQELLPHGVTVLSLYPGLVRTEKVMEAASAGVIDLTNSESPEYIGRVIAALAADPNINARTGSVIVAAEAGREFGVCDIDGKHPVPLTLDDV